jgi:hypothetical protein
MYLMTMMLCKALARFDNLVTLQFGTWIIDFDHFRVNALKDGLLRDSVHPAYSLLEMSTGTGPSSPLTMPKLQNLAIAGIPEMTCLAHWRGLRELEIRCPVDCQDIGELIVASDASVLGRSLETLSIFFARTVPVEIALGMLSGTFIHLKSLSIQASGVVVKVSSCCC